MLPFLLAKGFPCSLLRYQVPSPLQAYQTKSGPERPKELHEKEKPRYPRVKVGNIETHIGEKLSKGPKSNLNMIEEQ